MLFILFSNQTNPWSHFFQFLFHLLFLSSFACCVPFFLDPAASFFFLSHAAQQLLFSIFFFNFSFSSSQPSLSPFFDFFSSLLHLVLPLFIFLLSFLAKRGGWAQGRGGAGKVAWLETCSGLLWRWLAAELLQGSSDAAENKEQQQRRR
jgi:hypothetical protein